MPNNAQAASKKHELEEIDGIGPKIRAALVEGGVQTLADLGDSSGDKIESILDTFKNKKGRKIPANLRTPDAIEQWIQDAKAKVPAQQKSVAQTDSASTESQLATVPAFTVIFNYGDIKDGQQKRWQALIEPHEDRDKPEPSEWLPYPDDEGYTVRFEYQSSEDSKKRWRTVVVNGKSQHEETNITGWTPDEWWSWINEKASLTEETLQATPQGEEDLESEPPSVDDKPAVTEQSQGEKALRITRFEVRLPSDKRANTLVADVVFEISDELLEQQASQCQVEVLYVNLENNVSSIASYKSKQLNPEQSQYKSKVKFPMPELGRYKPHCVVLLLPSGEHGDYQEDSIFNVVPPKK